MKTSRPIAFLAPLVVGAALVGAAGLAAATPVAVSISPGFSFSAYTGSAPLYGGRVNTDNSLFFVQEQSLAGVQSWTVFFDPARNQTVSAVLDFGAPILNIYTRSADLDSSARTWGVDLNRDGIANDYLVHGASGLEGNDSLGWTAGSSVMSLRWTGSNPGDHVRVLVRDVFVQDVPEPATAALAVLALVVAGALGSRRQRQR